MEADFTLWMDRERARWFKVAWHEADLTPNAQAQWNEYLDIRAVLTRWALKDLVDNSPDTYSHLIVNRAKDLIATLEGTTDVHRRVMRSAYDAVLLTNRFFNAEHSFYTSDAGQEFKETRLRRELQSQRALDIPDTRSSTSCIFRDKSQFAGWDKLLKITSNGPSPSKTPKDWEHITRPIIAHLYKRGIISSGYHEAVRGFAISLREPGRENKPDSYFDWRYHPDPTAPYLENPYKQRPLLERAQNFAARLKSESHGEKKPVFTLLRMWSAPHFWPLMIGYGNRAVASFIDTVGRYWEWKFIPKDMPHSEYSMHHTARMRLNDYRPFFGGEELIIDGRSFSTKRHGRPRVEVLKDILLVMGEDVEDCKNLTEATVYAIEGRPWRWEVDPWKSFWKVDLEFLEKLDPKWWE